MSFQMPQSSLPSPPASAVAPMGQRLSNAPGEVVMPTAPTQPSSTAWPAMPGAAQQPMAPQASHVPQPTSQPAVSFAPPAVYAQQPQAPVQQHPQFPNLPPNTFPQQPMAPLPQVQQQASPFVMPQQQVAPQLPMQFSGPMPMAPDPALAPRGSAPLTDGFNLAGHVEGSSFPGVGQQVAAPAAPVGPPPAGAPHTQPQLPATTSVRDALVQQGYAVGHYQNDAQLLNDMGSMAGQLRQMQAFQHHSQVPPQQPQGQQPSGQQPPVQPTKPQAPEWRPEWENLVRKDERTGLYVPVDPMAVNPVIVQRANEYAQWRRERAEAMLRDPLSVLRQEGLDDTLKSLRQELKNEVVSEFRLQQQAEAEEREVQQFIDQNKAQFFHVDPTTGRELINPLTGDRAMTPRGEAFKRFANEYVAQFRNYYGQEPTPKSVMEQAQLRLQLADAQGLFGPQQQQLLPQQPGMPAYANVPAQPQNTIAQRVQAMHGAAYAPSQGGTIAAAAQTAAMPQNQNLSFTQMLINEAQRLGHVPLQ